MEHAENPIKSRQKLKQFDTMEKKAHQIEKEELKNDIKRFHEQTKAEQRYASYDFCYGYFQTHRHHLVENLELSCLHLWAYLASWGMLRGSSKLMKECSMKSLTGVIKYLDHLSEEAWNYDVQDYAIDETRKKILKIYSDLQQKLSDIKLEDDNSGVSPTKTLVTKIMLGTIGCVPAFDNFFVKTFKQEFSEEHACHGCQFTDAKISIKCAFSDLNEKALKSIYCFYMDNKETLNSIHYHVIGFNENNTMNLMYKKAKLIDMYGFNKSFDVN